MKGGDARHSSPGQALRSASAEFIPPMQIELSQMLTMFASGERGFLSSNIYDGFSSEGSLLHPEDIWDLHISGI